MHSERKMSELPEERLLSNALFAKQLVLDTQKALFDQIFPNDDFDFVINQWRTQNIFFALDTMAILGDELYNYPHGSSMTYLDVGAGPGFGTEFIADLFSDPQGAIHLECRALELSTQWQRIYPALNSHLSISTENLFDIPDKSFDIVACSHVIEHLEPDDAVNFVKKLSAVAREFAIVTCPFKEPEPRHPSHIHSIDENFINRLNPTSFEVLKSFGWNGPHKQSRIVGMLFRPRAS